MTDGTFDHSGSGFDSFLGGESSLEEAEASAVQRLVAWQLREEMMTLGITRDAMANRMGASRPLLNRLLDPGSCDVPFTRLTQGARAVMKRRQVEVVDAN